MVKLNASALLERLHGLRRVAVWVAVAYVVTLVGMTVGLLATTQKGPFPSWYSWTLFAGFFVGFWIVMVGAGVSYARRIRLHGDETRPSIFDGPSWDWQSRRAGPRQSRQQRGPQDKT